MKNVLQKQNVTLKYIYLTVIFLLSFLTTVSAQINYSMSLENGSFIDEKNLEFDIFLSTPDNVELVTYQCILTFNSTIKNGGCLTFNYIDQSSGISNTPMGVTACNSDGNEELSIGANVGSDMISNEKVKIGRFRLTNTVDFAQTSIDLTWDFNGLNYTALFTTAFSEFTNQANHINLTEPAPLPVELSSFSAAAEKTGIHLVWETKTEENNFGFEIEKLAQNDKWEKVGFVKGAGNSNKPVQYSYKDNEISGSTKFTYRLKQIDNDGNYSYSKTVETAIAITSFELFQNYPNPFNPSTTISFALVVKGDVQLTIYNILGEKVTDLVNRTMEAGIHKVNFNALNLASGAYIFRLNVINKFTAIKKMVLLK